MAKTKTAGKKVKGVGRSRYGVFISTEHFFCPGQRSQVIPDTFKTLAAAELAIKRARKAVRLPNVAAPRFARKLRKGEK